MKLAKKISTAALAFLLAAGMMAGCASRNNENGQSSRPSSETPSDNPSSSASAGQELSPVDQLGKPQKGQQVATIKVQGYGDIKIMLFPEVAPKGVENFVGLAKKGYYDGLKFHRVIKDFMAQTGDPKGNGTGGESVWGKGFGVEFDGRLRHYTGAVAYANSGQPDKNGSQFFLVNAPKISESDLNYLAQAMPARGIDVSFPDDVKKNYETVGGSASLDGQYTVFGQIYEGLDVLQKMMDAEMKENSMGEQASPVKDIIMESVTISTYEGE